MPNARRLNGVLDFASIVFPIGLLALILKTGVNLPFWDEWEWAELIYKMHLGVLRFSDLWMQHNEHRLLFPELLMLGLDRIGPWSPIREQILSVFFIVVTQIILIFLVRRTARRGWVSSIGMFFIALFLYGVWQSENFTWGFESAWFMCNSAAIVVVFLLSSPSRGALQVAAAIGVSIVASFTIAQGLIVWAVGGAAIVLMPRRVIATLIPWTLAALVTYAVYRNGLTPSAIEHFDIVRHPLFAAQYVLTYLGSPVAGWHGIHASEFAGFIGMVALSVAFVRDLIRHWPANTAVRRAPWYALAVLPIASAVATATGRASIGLGQALASRYTSMSGLLWIALAGVIITLLSRRSAKKPQWPKYLGAASASVVFILLVESSFSGWASWQAMLNVRSSAEAELKVNDPAALGKLYPGPAQARIKLLIEDLRRIKDGPFRNG